MTPRTQITRWNPFSELEDLQNLAKSFLTRFDEGPMLRQIAQGNVDWTPAVDVAEDDKEFTITADLPEVTKDNVKVTLSEGLLTIQGERRHEDEEKDRKYHRIERSFGKYVRSFQLPSEVDPEKIEAQFDSGVLKVHLPKTMGTPQEIHEIAVH